MNAGSDTNFKIMKEERERKIIALPYFCDLSLASNVWSDCGSKCCNKPLLNICKAVPVNCIQFAKFFILKTGILVIGVGVTTSLDGFNKQKYFLSNHKVRMALFL